MLYHPTLRQTDRQTDRQADRQADRQTDRQEKSALFYLQEIGTLCLRVLSADTVCFLYYIR